MFKITAGMGWTDSLPASADDGSLNYGNVLFVASYVVVVNWVLLQVSVAVLLDSFITARVESKRERERKIVDAAVEQASIQNAADPLFDFYLCVPALYLV